jgi:hypothetical protein
MNKEKMYSGIKKKDKSYICNKMNLLKKIKRKKLMGKKMMLMNTKKKI